MGEPMNPLRWAAAGVVGLAAAGLAAFLPRGQGASGVPPAPSVAAARVSCDAPQIRDCTFYAQCVEHNVPCGASGYAIGFGDKYCNKFKATQLSPVGAAWTSAVMLCLQQELIPFTTPAKKSSSCDQIAQAAFDSHADCYTRATASICFLPPADITAIFDTIGTDELFQARTRKQIQDVIEVCVLQFADPGPYAPRPPDTTDGGVNRAEQRACWIHLREKYKNPR